MGRRFRQAAVAAGLVTFAALPAVAQSPGSGPYPQAEELPVPSPSADVLGRPLAYPPGNPVVRTFRITVPQGARSDWHLHEVPLTAYVISGTLEVDYGTRGKRTFRAGETVLEAVAWCHASRAVGDAPVVLVATYIGNGILKNTAPCTPQ